MPGFLALMLHAHLPFVRHPEHEKFLEENWLFEAITETYIPLIQIMDGWRADRRGRPPHPVPLPDALRHAARRALQERYGGISTA